MAITVSKGFDDHFNGHNNDLQYRPRPEDVVVSLQKAGHKMVYMIEHFTFNFSLLVVFKVKPTPFLSFKTGLS